MVNSRPGGVQTGGDSGMEAMLSQDTEQQKQQVLPSG